MTSAHQADSTGVILVGGKSRRMGQDKAFLTVGGTPVIERIIAVFRQQFGRLLLVGDRPERFAGYGLDVVPDLYPGSSLGGLYTGLYHADTNYIFVSSCDIPFPSGKLIDHLCGLRNGFDAVVPFPHHGYEPLFALYAKTCLEPMREQLERGDFCAHGYYPRIRVRYVRDDELSSVDPSGRSLVNVNTPDEFNLLVTEAAP